MLYLRSFNRFILISLALIGLSTPSANLQASIVYDFDISDTSWATITSTPTFGAGDSLSVAFLDSTDFNSLQESDLESITFDLVSIGAYQNFPYDPTTWSTPGFNDIFGYDGSNVTITVGGPAEDDPFVNLLGDEIAVGFQLGQNNATSILYKELGPPEFRMFAYNPDNSHTYIGSLSVPNPVPVPAAVWLFGTALVGFIGFSRRRKVA